MKNLVITIPIEAQENTSGETGEVERPKPPSDPAAAGHSRPSVRNILAYINFAIDELNHVLGYDLKWHSAIVNMPDDVEDDDGDGAAPSIDFG